MKRSCRSRLKVAPSRGARRHPPAAPSDGSATLTRLLDAAPEQAIRASVAAQLKYARPIERLPSVSLAEEEARARTATALLDTLATVPRESLSEAEQISAEALEWMLRGDVESPKYYWLSLRSSTSYQSPLTNELLFLGRDMLHGFPPPRGYLRGRTSHGWPPALRQARRRVRHTTALRHPCRPPSGSPTR